MDVYISYCAILDVNATTTWVTLPSAIHQEEKEMSDEKIDIACQEAIVAHLQGRNVYCVHCRRPIVKWFKIQSSFTLPELSQRKMWLVLNCGKAACQHTSGNLCTAEFTRVRTALAKAAGQTLEVQRRCHYCRVIKEKMAKCSRCNLVYYCSVECQRAERKIHAMLCKPQ
jgi:hypothetical protein